MIARSDLSVVPGFRLWYLVEVADWSLIGSFVFFGIVNQVLLRPLGRVGQLGCWW